MLWKKDVLFCDINPTCYAISERKEIIKRHLKDLFSKESIAKKHTEEKLPNLVASYSCHLIKTGPGVDLTLQENKAVNIRLASAQINGIVIQPGETFSFWRTVGNTTKRRGYKDGRVIIGNKLRPGIGGGLCNLGNMIHRMVVQSPLTVTEFHKHSDALSPDEGERIPLSTGTSVSYNNIDYRFKNNTNQPVQILVWCADNHLYGELRSKEAFPQVYEIVEENHHFHKDGDVFYRISKIYRNISDRNSGELLEKELILDNVSEVMYDYALIPADMIR